jgi:hypothetical protein
MNARRPPVSTLFSLASLVVGIVPIACIALGFYHAGMCDPAPIAAGLWLLAMTFIGSVVGFVSIYAAGKIGQYIKISAAVTILNILCFVSPIVYLFFMFVSAH